MIQSLRENLSGTVAIVLIALIAIPLAFFGVESIFLNSSRINEVATVNGETITEIELERAVIGQINETYRVLGDQVDPAMVDQDRLRPGALDALIDQKILLAEARDEGLSVSDAYLAERIREMEIFQVGGQFNQTTFRTFLANMGYTPTTFIEALHEETIANQFLVGLRASSFATQTDLEQLVAIIFETRSWQQLTIPGADIPASVEVSDEEVESYYQIYQEDFRRPEEVSLNYVRLSADAFMAQTANQQNLADLVLERYELLKAQESDERRVAHILFEEKDGASVADQVAQVQERLAAGESFASLASEFSADIGSYTIGGDLGYTAGDTFPATFEAAAAQLAVGEVSDLVLTEVGSHLIQVTDIQESSFDLESQYATLELAIRNELAEDMFLDALEEIRGLTFSTDNLQELVETFREPDLLNVESSLPFSRDLGTGIASDARVRAVGFSDVVLNDQFNELVELSNREALVVHLNEYAQSRIAAVDEVRSAIVATLRSEKAGELVAQRAADLEAEIAAGATLDSVAEREGYSWQAMIETSRNNAGVAAPLVFTAAANDGLPVVGGGLVGAGDYLVYRLIEVNAGLMEDQLPETLAQLRENAAVDRGQMEWLAYLASMQLRAKIDRKVTYAEDLEI